MPESKLPRLAILIALISLLALTMAFVAVLVLRGGAAVAETPAVVTVLGFVSLIVTNLLLALQAGHNAEAIQTVQGQVGDVQQKINGHVEEHVQAALAAAGVTDQPTPPAGPEGGTGNAP